MATPNTDEQKNKPRMVMPGGSEKIQGVPRPETKTYAEMVALQKPLISDSMMGKIPGAAYGADMLREAKAATAKGGLGAGAGSLIRASLAAPIAVVDDTLNAVEPYVRPFAQTLKTAVTGDATPIGQQPPKTIAASIAPQQSAAAQPAAAPASPASTAAPAAPSAAPGPTIGQSVASPNTGTINVTKQPNGVMSFSGKGDVSGGYSGAAAGQLKGGGYIGSVTPEDRQAALGRAANDKAALTALALSAINTGGGEGLDKAYRIAGADPDILKAVDAARVTNQLRDAALAGDKNATELLRQQNVNETALGVEASRAGTEKDKLGIAQGVQDLQRKQFESSDAVNKLTGEQKQMEIDKQKQITALTDELINMDPTSPDFAKKKAKYDTLLGLNKPVTGKDRYMSITGGTDETGVKQPDQVFDTATRQYVKTGGTVTKAQVDAAAAAKGITDPAQLQSLYATYGVQ